MVVGEDGVPEEILRSVKLLGYAVWLEPSVCLSAVEGWLQLDGQTGHLRHPVYFPVSPGCLSGF